MNKNELDFNLEFEEEDDQDIENVSFNIDIIKNNIPKFSSHKLCEMIVCDRYFGFEKSISIPCMEELSKRRDNGDNFDFENYIDNSYNELPQLQLLTPDLRTILNQVTKIK